MPDSKKDDLGYYTEEPCPEKLLVQDKENMTVLWIKAIMITNPD